MDEMKDRIVHVLARVLRIPPDTLQNADKLVDLEKWDSLNHLNFVMEVEKEFGVRFDIQEVVQINSISKTIDMLHRKIA
jgi:acyl carrier protein